MLTYSQENTRAHLAPHPTSDNNFDEHFDLREDRRRGRDDYEDDDVVYTGTLEAAKRPRIQAGSVDDDEDGTPLREMAEGEVGCEACGCSCQARVDGPGGGIGGRRMGGSGSTTLSVGVRANILGTFDLRSQERADENRAVIGSDLFDQPAPWQGGAWSSNR